MKINWKVRFKNPHFIAGLVSAVAAPILTYFGLTTADLTSWTGVWEIIVDFVSNPYLIGSTIFTALSFIGIFNDPTTKGLSDSEQAMTYDSPKSDSLTTDEIEESYGNITKEAVMELIDSIIDLDFAQLKAKAESLGINTDSMTSKKECIYAIVEILM